MSEPPARAHALNLFLRRVQWGVLGTLGICALLSLAASPADPDACLSAPRRSTLAALALAAGSILARRRAARPRTHALLAIASLLLACGIGLLGAAAALTTGDRQTALLYVLGGALLAARRPASVTA